MLGGVNMYIGMPDNYPPGANPFVNMHFLVFDASGPGGLPGTIIDGPFNFIPANFGWNTFLFGSTVTIGNGDFYIVHVQDGVYPLTSCVFTDNSAMSDNSFLRDMPNGNWEPAGGNIMMRALLYGPGGPEPAGMNTTGYQVYRFTHGQEGTPADWVSVTSTDLTECIDPAWGSLPNNIYLWAVKAVYSGNRFSDPSFSNYLEKVQPVTVVQNLAIGSGQDPCIEASQTVIIAGGETFFIVADGGSADIVAGHNILLYPWTKIYSGGYLHAFITTNGQYCPGKKEAMVAAGTVSDAQNDLDAVVRKSFFSVYPNPTDGIFTLELNEDPGPGDMVIRIYSITGEQVFTRVLPGRTKTEIDLGERPSGIYIVKVNAENGSGSARIIRR
jgi:hypothetical protein